jgi:RNA polymerase sigma factor (sigma-70 family)
MNREEFQIQVYPLRNKLFRFAKRILDQAEEAEDVVQDAFIRLWTRRETLEQYRSIEALAMLTTKNLCLDRIKKRKYPVERMDNHRGFIENLPMETTPDYSEEMYRIKQAMNELTEAQKMIIQLRDIEGYEYETIASIMEMNENAVRVNLSRARKRIREMMQTNKVYEYQRN